MTHDLTYITDSLYTRFIANTSAGEDAWREMATHNSTDDGIDAVTHDHNRQALNMVRYFHAIPCDQQRQRIVELMRVMGGAAV